MNEESNSIKLDLARLMEVMTAQRYTSRTCYEGISLSDSVLFSDPKAQRTLGAGTIEFTRTGKGLEFRKDIFQSVQADKFYYDPNTHEVLFLVSNVIPAMEAFVFQTWAAIPVSRFVSELNAIRGEAELPSRPVSKSSQWISKIIRRIKPPI